ncbi:mblk-1-related factor 1-like [Diabrotica undecimpunctata]|uniref:mblk-1-related factor 1-like n=1 Tax=Diabrotica undecimpunctata TaxID=50387 RepID=UPI003B631CA3
MPKLRKYDKMKLTEAIKDVQNGTESYRTAEKKYGIPKSTVEFKLKHPEHKNTLGPSPILTCEEENTLVRWIQETASKGFPKKANDLKSSVQKFLIENPRLNNFKDNRPGDGWLKGFLKRHPGVSRKTSEGVTAASACDCSKMPKLRKYDKMKLIKAIKDVQNGTESYRTAEKKYGIPKSTIEFKLKHPEHKDTLGPSPILTCEEENTLVRWIQETASKGFPKKANDLKSSVQKFLIENPRLNNFKDNRPGDGWLKDSDSDANNSNQDSEDEDIDELFTQYKEAQKHL